jgi:tRNA1Val (adenine37-N6)-methyltransferase
MKTMTIQTTTTDATTTESTATDATTMESTATDATTMDTTLDEIGGLKILQPAHGYRFSIDALLLAHFAGLKNPNLRPDRGVKLPGHGVMRIADLGAGSGVIGIALATRFLNARVTLVEVQERLLGLSVQNIALNGLQGRVEALSSDIREIRTGGGLGAEGFDLVVSNPPFRRLGAGKTNPCEEKLIARHEVRLTLPELFGAAAFLLGRRGRFCFIHQVQRFVEVVQELKAAGLEPKRAAFVHGRADTEARMFLMEAVRGGRSQFTMERPFFIFDPAGEYTKEAQALFTGTGYGLAGAASRC